MLSANNQNADLSTAEVAKQRQTIKKLTVGVSSILLGLTFAGVTNAHADTNTPVNSASESNATVSSDQVINTNAKAQVLKVATTDASSSVSVNVNSASADTNSSAVASQSAATADAASAASSASTTAASDVKTPVADSYEAAVTAAVDATSANTKSAAAATTETDSSAASSASVATTDDQNSASATTKDDEAAKTPAPEEQLEVTPVQMTQYNAQPYSESQREANAQAGQQIVNDVVSVFTSKTITGRIGAGISFVKDTINLIARHPLAYQRYQNMTARQIKYANQQRDLAMKEIRMKKAHKPQWQINFVIWQQRQLSNWQHDLEIQRQTMIGYLQANNANALA